MSCPSPSSGDATGETPKQGPPTDIVAANDFLRVVFDALRLSRARRRTAILEWHACSTCGTTEDAAVRDALHKSLVAGVAVRLRLPLRLSRVRLVTRVLVILVVAYVDLITDIGMLFEYNADGNHDALAASACFLGLGWVMHVYFAYLQTQGRNTSIVCKEILMAATFTAPAVSTYRFIVGGAEEEEKEEDGDSSKQFGMSSVFPYMFIKVIELSFESVPESILQASNLMKNDARKVTPFSILSMASSILAAG